jgi:hypothetical protein
MALVVAQRIGVDDDDEIPLLMAALAVATARSGLERWAAQTSNDNDDSPAPYVEHAAAVVQTFFTSHLGEASWHSDVVEQRRRR